MSIIKTLGSLAFAVTLIATLAVLLVVSTALESAYGTPFAQNTFYHAGWFDFFLFLFWINIFCSAALRWPFKKHHTGFLTTHLGILLLLMGALLTRLFAAEGQLSLVEGERGNSIVAQGHRLVVMLPEEAHKAISLGLRDGQPKKPYELKIRNADFSVKVHRILPAASLALKVEEGGSGDAPNAAVRLHLRSGRAGLDEAFWLVENDPQNPEAATLQLGPATLVLESPRHIEKKAVAAPTLTLTRGDKSFQMEVSSGTPAEAPASDIGLTLRNIKFYPRGRVENDKLVDAPEGSPENPAISFEAVDAQGRSENHTKFAVFPEFESLHGGGSSDVFGLKVRLDAPLPVAESSTGAKLKLISAADGSWKFESTDPRGEQIKGDLKTGTPTATGWMDMTFEAESILNRAKLSRTVEAAKGKGNGAYAAEVSLVAAGVESPKRWVMSGEPELIETAQGDFRLLTAPNEIRLPFTLTLKDFRKTDYPGTEKPASFESDVQLEDAREKLKIEKTISMNKPLDYAGWRVFQSSYFQEDFGEGSVFTVAKNPGIVLIYSGAVILFMGVFTLFYIPPFSSFAHLSQEKRKESAHAKNL